MINAEQKADYEDILDIGELLLALYKRLSIIILTAVLCASAGFCYSRFLATQQYQASATMIVNSGYRNTEYVTGDQLATSASLVELYGTIIRSDAVMNTVYQNLQTKDMSKERVTGILVLSVNNTQVMEICVNATNPKYALVVCEEITSVAPEVIQKYMGAGSVNVLSAASASSTPISPNIMENTVKAGLFGLIAVCGIIVLATLLDNKVRKKEDFKRMSLPLLGVIPDFNQEDK